MLAVHLEPPTSLSARGARCQQLGVGAAFDLLKEPANAATSGSALHPLRFAHDDGGAIRLQEEVQRGHRVSLRNMETVRSYEQTRGEPGKVPGDRRQRAFVEVVEVEVGEAVISLERAEVLEVKVSAHPSARSHLYMLVQRTATHVLIEEVTGAAEEGERIA